MTADCVSPLSLWLSFTSSPSLRLACQVILEGTTEATHMPFQQYLVFFMLTCLMEGPIYWWATPHILSPLRRIFVIFWVNIATHPVVTWVFPLLFSRLHRPNRETILTSELFAPVIEALMLKFQFKLPWHRALLASGVANLLSWWGGAYLAYLLGP